MVHLVGECEAPAAEGGSWCRRDAMSATARQAPPPLSLESLPLPLRVACFQGRLPFSAFRQGRGGRGPVKPPQAVRRARTRPGPTGSAGCSLALLGWENLLRPPLVFGPCSVVASCSCPAGHTDTLRSALSRRSQRREHLGFHLPVRPGLLHRQWGRIRLAPLPCGAQADSQSGSNHGERG